MDPASPVFLTQGPLARMRELQGLLDREGIAADVVAPSGADGKG